MPRTFTTIIEEIQAHTNCIADLINDFKKLQKEEKAGVSTSATRKGKRKTTVPAPELQRRSAKHMAKILGNIKR